MVPREIVVLVVAWLYVAWPLLRPDRVVYGFDTYAWWAPTFDTSSRALRSGKLPLWSTEMFGGVPFLGRIGSAAIYPLHLPLMWFEAARALQISVAIHLLLLVLGFWALMRFGLRLGGAATVVVPIAVLGCGFVATRSLAIDQIIPLAATPWILLFAEKTIRSNTYKSCFGLASSIALLLLGGHPQYIYQLALVVPVLCLARMFDSKSFRSFPKLAVASILGLGMSALQLIATWALTRTSAISGTRPLEILSNPAYNLEPSQIGLGILGSTFADVPANAISNGESLAGLGLTCCLLAVGGLLLHQRKFRLTTISLALIAISSTLFAVGPKWMPFRVAYDLVPGFGGARVPGRWMLQTVICLALLAGIGLDGASRLVRDVQHKVAGILCLAVAVIVVATVPDGVSHLTRYWWFLGGCGVALWILFEGRRRIFIVMIPLLFAGIEFMAAGRNTPVELNSHDASFADYESDFTRFLSGKSGRVLSLTFDAWDDERYMVTNLRPNTNVGYDIASIDGYDGGMWIQKRWVNAFSSLTNTPFNIDLTIRSQAHGPYSADLLRRLGVRYVLTDTSVVPAGAQLTGLTGPVLKRGPIELWSNPLWAADGLAYTSTRQVTSGRSVRSALLQAAKSGAPSAITEPGAPSVDCQTMKCDPIGVPTEIRRDGSFLSDLNLEQPTVVAINQGWSRDWKVKVNGKPVSTFPINGFFLGVEVPSGPAQIRGEFMPGWVVPGMFISFLTGLTALALSIVPGVLERRRKHRAYSVTL